MNDIASLRLLLMTDTERFPGRGPMEELVRGARRGSVAVVLRERQLSLRDRLRLGKQLRELTESFGQLLFVADRADLALAVSADGLHLGRSALAPRAARQLLSMSGASCLLTRGLHEGEALMQEDLEALDGVLLSPVFSPRKGRTALGASGFGRIGSELRARHPGLALFALGGATSQVANEAFAVGATGLAVISAAYEEDASRWIRALGIAPAS